MKPYLLVPRIAWPHWGAAALFLVSASLAMPAVAADWEQAMGTEFPGGMRSVWILESVAQRGSEWVITVAFRNGSRSERTLQLRTGDPDAAVLLVEGQALATATDIGAATKVRSLKRNATVRSAFRFSALSLVSGTAVMLRTRWVIRQDMAADRFPEIMMPFTVP